MEDESSVAKGKKPQKIARGSFRYLRLLVYAEPTAIDILLLVVGTISAIASGIPFPLVGILFGQLIDDLNSATCSDSAVDPATQSVYQSDVNSKILVILYLAIAQFVTMYAHLVCWSLGGARLAQRLREKYFHSLLSKEATFFDNLPAGEVSSRLNNDIQTIRNGTSEKVGICLSSASFFVTAYVVAFIKNSTLAGMLVSLVPAYFLMSLVGGHYVEKYAGQMSDSVAAAASIASECLSNILVVHAFNANNRLETKFAADLLTAKKQGVKKAFATGVQSGFMYFIAYAANGLAFWQGSKAIAKAVGKDAQGATVGSTFTVIFILVDATLVLSQVAPFLQMFAAASASFQKLEKDMDYISAIDGTSEKGLKISSTSGQIELHDVSFTYPSRPEMPVLQHISLSCDAGKHTAIVGLSGSGKSTIAGLMVRIYDPTEGQVTLDGQDLRELNTRQVRSFMSLVQQEAMLLDRSILENIAHGLVNSSIAEEENLTNVLLGSGLSLVAAALRDGQDIKNAAEAQGPQIARIVDLVHEAIALADAATFIQNLQYQLGTVVGPSGRLMSGGQRQRIALARALIKNPKILILDEATASVDSKSEQSIMAAVGKISSGKTVVSIAHRLSTIKNADKIIVLKDGRILEQGSHEDLMTQQGAYAGLVALQNISPNSKADDTSSTATAKPTMDDVSIDKEAALITISNDERDTTDQRTDKSEQDVEAIPESDPDANTSKSWSVFKHITPMIRPHILIAILALAASSVVGGAFSAEAVIFGNTVERLNPCKSESSILSAGRFFGLMFFVLAIIEFFANIVSWSGFGWLTEHMMYDVRFLTFHSLLEQDLQWHQSEGRTPTGLLSYITNDGNLLAGLSGSIVGTIFSIVVNLIAAIILTHIVAWKIAIVCLSVVPLLLGVGVMQLRVLAQFEERHETAFNKSVDISVEAVNSIKAIASLSLEDETLAVYRRALTGPRKEVTVVSFHANIWLALAYFLGNLIYALAYWWGSKQIITGKYSQAQFLIVVFSLLVSAQLWTEMFALAPEISNARAAVSRIVSILDISPSRKSYHSSSSFNGISEKDVEAVAESKQKSLDSPSGLNVEFQNVSFAYPARPQAQVLNGLSLKIPAGKFCALVGPSGTGKSTIISLIEKMYIPSEGSILVDGIDITQRADITFRDDIALVPQESVLFEGSVRFNVSLGARPGHEASDLEVEEACKLANIHDTIIKLPQGYDTPCGANGGQLSGGQKQRLAIARALVRKPRLLILDESTSALDAESEKLLQDGLEKAAKDITVLAIAHRLNTIKKADIIFSIFEGRCVDQGTHEELFERSESYRANVLHQMTGE